MAPEQVLAQPADGRADQFALGAILYEMLTGRRAFRRETPFQTMSSILEDEPLPIAESRTRSAAGAGRDRRTLPREASGRSLRIDARSRA